MDHPGIDRNVRRGEEPTGGPSRLRGVMSTIFRRFRS
jgi:hypothetical protein